MNIAPIVTFTTDFGLQDGFTGSMKGVLLSICPAARIVDISHDIPVQNVLAAALTLQRAYAYFPSGTIHVAVVDPGVGTARRPIAVRAGGHLFVGPDNGLFTFVVDAAEKAGLVPGFFHLTEERFWLGSVSRTFHGRDIFTPVAAHLANGVAVEKMGIEIRDAVRLSLSVPERTANGWQAHLIAIDHFGNLTTDLPAAWLGDPGRVSVRIRGREIRGLSSTYGDRPSGTLIALADSEGRLEIAVVNGSAARATLAQVGDPVEVVE